MKNLLKYAAAMCTAFAMNAQTAGIFQPYQSTDLRLPSVPLVVSDPYFSIWSPYNQLTDGTPRHWTNDEKPLEGILRVDGKPYRFMGVKNTVFEAIVPMADEGAWTAMTTRKNPGHGWARSALTGSVSCVLAGIRRTATCMCAALWNLPPKTLREICS